MRSALKVLLVTLAMAFAVACSSTEYIISTTGGMMITASGKPKLDEKTGMYTYTDAEGRAATIKKDDVKQIMER
jgi:hypothetical protein